MPISNTNFSNEVRISESYDKNVTSPKTFEILCPLTIKWGLFQFLAKFVKNLFDWLILFNFTNNFTKGNKAVANSGSGKF